MTVKQTRLHHLERQITRIERRTADLRRLSDRYVQIRVGIALAGLVLTFLAFSQISDSAGYFSALAGLIVFITAARQHGRVQRSIQRHVYWRRLKQTHAARIRLDWTQLRASDASAPAEHPFAHDLDIVGQRSIHRLLDTAVSLEGSQRLADWLLAETPDPVAIQQRQNLVGELQRLTHFRDRLTLLGWLTAGKADGSILGGALLAWFRRDTSPGPTRFDLAFLIGLAAVNAVLFIGAAVNVIPTLWQWTFLVYLGYSLWRLRALGDLFSQAMSLADVLRDLHGIFHYLEHRNYDSTAHLKALCQPFLDANKPSAQLRRLGRIITATSLRGNPVLWTLVNAVLPWDMLCAALLARQRTQLAGQMPVWLDTWYELETLNALATFAYLNPEYTRPIITEGCRFVAQRIGHPLLAADAKVCNDFSLTEKGALVIITGSNMTGKSSFLRTMGVNLVLAYAGGHVNADHLETSLFRVYSTIRINDSVTEGFSYFYAEVRRLKQLLLALETDHPYPLFFLIDEIFKGTNNRERLIGSRAYIRALGGQNGIGAVSTHDLELVQLADAIPQVTNYHFREDVVDGRMSFDYRLRPGPCPTTNALKIMALEGLPVDETDGIRS